MELKALEHKFSVCKVKEFSSAELNGEFCFIGKTDEESSLVCLTEDASERVTDRDDGRRAFRIQGIPDFSLIGILAEISAILAKEKIGIFAVSTFNTDYILTKEENFERAIKALSDKGMTIV